MNAPINTNNNVAPTTPAIKTKGIITKVAYGWDEVESAIIAFVAAELPFVFQGVHGNAKTSVGKLIGYCFGDGTFRYFDCSKANLLSMAGFPDAEKMKAGEQAFVPNNRSLIGSDKHPVSTILLDELGRTPKEAQNLLLETIENKSIFGIPTGHRVLIATMNPTTYRSAVKLDAALIDRFVAYLPVPDYKESSAEDIENMIRINMLSTVNDKYIASVGSELKDVVDKVRTRYLALLQDTSVQARLSAYVSQLFDMAKSKFGNDEEAPYFSGREQSNQLWRAILALAAFYIETKNRAEPEALVDAAQEALKYCLITKHSMVEKYSRILETVHNTIRFILKTTGTGKAGELQIAYARTLTPQSKLTFLEQYYDDIVKHCDASMQTEMLESTLESVNNYAPRDAKKKKNVDGDTLMMRAKLYSIAKRKQDFSSISDKLEGSLICQLVCSMNNAGATIQQSPYKEALGNTSVKASDIVDLLVHMSGGTKSVPF
jgi:MoxR-like ATPase